MLNIYKASAGSGKTYTLTREYLRLLLGRHNAETGEWRLRQRPEQAHRHILAITFTNKATQEMTRRIIRELAVLGHRERDNNAESPYADYFTDFFHTDRDTLASLASDLLDDLLFDFAYFHVSTIDAFFQNVLRIFAREVEVPDNFELELDNKYTISLGVNEMFSSINYPEPVDPAKKKERQWMKDWLTSYMEARLDEGLPVNLFARSSSVYNTLITTFTSLIDENFKLNNEHILEYLSDVNRLSGFEKALNREQKMARDRATAAATRAMQYGDFPQTNRYVAAFIEKLSAGGTPQPSATVTDSIHDESKRFRAAYIKKGDIPPDFNAAVTDACREGVALSKMIPLYRTVRSSIADFGLLGCLLRYIDDYCKDNNLILLSETNSLLRDIINDDDTPFVYERLGYYLRNFLIDEFQDTSRMQWDNLKPLVIESLSHGHDNLIIGDEKQCIYRFRNSDPDLLGHEAEAAVADIYGDGATAVKGTDIEDNNNWRSSYEVVTFNNSLFHAIARAIDQGRSVADQTRSSVSGTYSTAIQRVPDKHLGVHGHVKLIFRPAPDNDNSSDGSDDNEDHNDSKDEFILSTLTDEVDRLLTAGYRPRDIAVLVRTHSEGEKVINRLMAAPDNPTWHHGPVGVTSTDSLGINSSAAVRMIITILRLSLTPEYLDLPAKSADGNTATQRIVNPAYRRARLMQRYEFFLHTPVKQPDGTSTQLTPEQALDRALESMRGSNPSNDIVNATVFSATSTDGERVRCSSLDSIIERIIATHVAPEVLPRETVFLTAFQDLVHDFCARGNSDIRSFLDWWDRSGCHSGISSTAEADAINVMTIHQSKGLEFKCVLLPFADWKMVKYHTSRTPSYGWYTLGKDAFPSIHPDLIPPMLPLKFESRLRDMAPFADQANIVASRQAVDSLNVAYVAFTRAVNELVVITHAAPAGKQGATTLGQYIAQAIDSLSAAGIAADTTVADNARRWIVPLKEMLDDGVLEYGIPTTATAADASVNDEATVEAPVYLPGINDSLTTLSVADIDFFDFDRPRHRGEFLHHVLSHVRHRNDLDLALRRAAYRARLSSAQTAWCAEILQKAIHQPEAGLWFDNYTRILNERTIVSDGIDRRPDRIVWTADGTIDVVDYKFGEHDDRYLTQVRRYVELMRRAGYESVRGFLWYPMTGVIISVDSPQPSNHSQQ